MDGGTSEKEEKEDVRINDILMSYNNKPIIHILSICGNNFTLATM